MINFQRPLGAGFNAREAEPSPAPKPERSPKPPAVGASTYAGHRRQYPASKPDLLPGFPRFSESLGAELAAEEAIRQGKVKEHLGPSEEERLRIHRELLGEQVRANEITNEEANTLFAKAHPGIDPASLRPIGEQS